MYRKILVTVNEHLNSEVAARYALRLAGAAGSQLYLCFIAERGLAPHDFDRAEEAVKRLFAEAEGMGVPVEALTRTGEPVAEIDRIVRHEKIGLVFVSTRREDIQRRFYSGSVARRLSLRLPCSVALVRVVHLGRVRPRSILVPLKGKIDRIRERAHFTALMAACCDARVIVFHLTKPITKIFHGEVHLTPPEWEKRLPRDIAAFMDDLKRQGTDYEGVLSPGTAAGHIAVEAAAHRHDLIIMGASQRSLLSSLLRGNPVEEVLRETPCDLIIFSPRHED